MDRDARSIGERIRGPMWIVVVLAAVIATWWLRGQVRVRPPASSPVAAGTTFVDLSGATVPIESLRGRIVILNLWASWCGPCVSEIPALERVERAWAGRGVQVIGINVDDVDLDDVPELVSRLDVDFRVVVAPEGLAPPLNPGGVIPHTWLVDREGRVRASHAGVVREAALDRAVRRLLAEDRGPDR